MEYTNCPKCKKMFYRINSPICPECVKDDEAQFKKIKDYLDNNPYNTIAQVANATGVSMKKILKLLKEERLEMTPGLSTEAILTCQRCGASIRSGVMCHECKSKYNTAVLDIMNDSRIRKENERRNAGMHSIPSLLDKKGKER